ncbi:MAG: hypothetical protein ACOCYT_02370 [Chloroflexota bacterium]
MSDPQISNEDLLQLGIKAAKRKDRDNARMLLMQVYERDKRNEQAMLWLARVAGTRQERITWLERVLEYNPDHEQARKVLERIQYKEAAEENRALVLYGGIAALMIILTLAIILVAVLT